MRIKMKTDQTQTPTAKKVAKHGSNEQRWIHRYQKHANLLQKLEDNEVGKSTSSPCVYKHTHTQIHACMLQHLNTNTTFHTCDEVLCTWYWTYTNFYNYSEMLWKVWLLSAVKLLILCQFGKYTITSPMFVNSPNVSCWLQPCL
jgi:hypothetical protein